MTWRTNRLFLSFCIKYRANDAFLARRSHFQVTGKLPGTDSGHKFRVSLLFSWNVGSNNTLVVRFIVKLMWNVRVLYWAANCQVLGCSSIFYGISLFNNCEITWQSKWIVEKSLFPSTSFTSSCNIGTNALAPFSWCIALKRLVLEWVAT